jgi:hypothetical protein
MSPIRTRNPALLAAAAGYARSVRNGCYDASVAMQVLRMEAETLGDDTDLDEALRIISPTYQGDVKATGPVMARTLLTFTASKKPVPTTAASLPLNPLGWTCRAGTLSQCRNVSGRF